MPDPSRTNVSAAQRELKNDADVASRFIAWALVNASTKGLSGLPNLSTRLHLSLGVCSLSIFRIVSDQGHRQLFLHVMDKPGKLRRYKIHVE